jgi:hypothetical protein
MTATSWLVSAPKTLSVHYQLNESAGPIIFTFRAYVPITSGLNLAVPAILGFFEHAHS